MGNDFWKNQIEQINITNDLGVELVPRVGNHIIYIGQLPWGKYKSQIDRNVAAYVNKKLDRMLKFYKYGLSKVGWNKYSYIDVELDNQIVCTLRHEVRKEDTAESEAPEADKAQPRSTGHHDSDSLARHDI